MQHGLEAWLSVEKIASHLGVSKETIYRWLEKGKIPAHRIGRLWKFKASEVDEWIRKGGSSDPLVVVRKAVRANVASGSQHKIRSDSSNARIR